MLKLRGLGAKLPESVVNDVEAAGLGDLLRYLDVLYSQAFYAKCEHEILQALNEASNEYQTQLECAGCFYSFSRMALQESLFMNCALLYDGRSDINLHGLLKYCRELEEKISYQAIELCGKRPDFNAERPIRHFVAEAEECFFQDVVNSQRAFDCIAGGDWKSPVVLHLNVGELLDLFGKRINGMSKSIDLLREQRNKIYAHSGMESLDYDAFAEESGLTVGEITRLIDCALDITREIYAMITNVCRPSTARNVNDVEGLLRLAKLGWDTMSKYDNIK